MAPPRRIHSDWAPSYSDPIVNGAAVTPSDTEMLPNVTRWLYVGVAGNLTVTLMGGGTVTLSNAPVGWHRVCATQVWATGTTAGDIVAGW